MDKELELIKKYKVKVISLDDKGYPAILKEIHSAPKVLYVRGEILQEGQVAVAIVGSRVASHYGLTASQKLGYELASRGVVVVSGLARGIDSAAHKGAIKAHGKTIAVLGSGLAEVYPPENRKLADEIVESGGALVSEFPMETEPLSWHFPRRNRIISGLSLGVVVVEAAKNSGALITADFALEQNREVFAVPGMIDAKTSFGTNELIKQGAKLIQTADDIIEGLELKLKISAKKDKEFSLRLNLSAEESAVYEGLDRGSKYIDDIAESLGISASKVSGLLVGLQIKKLVKELPGKYFIRA